MNRSNCNKPGCQRVCQEPAAHLRECPDCGAVWGQGRQCLEDCEPIEPVTWGDAPEPYEDDF